MNEMHFLPLVEQGRIKADPLTGEVMVMNTRTGQYRPARRNMEGYVVVNCRIPGKGAIKCQAHRLLWAAAYGPIDAGLQINHIDGDKANNALSNLEVVTPRENTIHARDVLGRYYGEKNANARLSAANALEIHYRARAGERLDDLAEEFGICREAARLIKHGRRWTKTIADVASNERSTGERTVAA